MYHLATAASDIWMSLKLAMQVVERIHRRLRAYVEEDAHFRVELLGERVEGLLRAVSAQEMSRSFDGSAPSDGY